MSISSDAILAYGLSFDPDHQFPWGTDDIEDWWIDLMGINNSTHPDHEEYYKAVGNANKKLPVRLLNHCSGSYTRKLLYIPETCQYASRGDVIRFNFEEMSKAVNEESLGTFHAFLEQFGIKPQDEHGLSWILVSYLD